MPFLARRPGQIGIERLEPLGGIEEQLRCFAATPTDECDLSSYQIGMGALELAEWLSFGNGEKL